MQGDFYVVATPIGNLSDITLRALEVLKSVDFIACEDTRVTKKLLQKYDINVNVFDYHKFNEKKCSEKIIKLLKEGKSIALVSDAGTPGISDPGCILYEELNQQDIKINCIPGACAVTTLLSGVPRENEYFTFVGFISKNKTQQLELFEKYDDINLIFYESPNRLLTTLECIKEFNPDKKVVVGRELTKTFEEIKSGNAFEIMEYYKKNTLKGEIIVMAYASPCLEIEDTQIISYIKKLKAEKISDKDISKILSSLFGINKNKAYKLSIEI